MVHPVQRYRAERGWSQEELAERSGVNRVTVSRIETGTASNIRKSTLTALASALGVDRKELER